MSQEIINVLNYLAGQLGIAIDWTSENVWPQVMDILGRYRLMEIISTSLCFFAEVVMIICGLVVVTKCIKANAKIRVTKEDNFWWYKGYSTIWMSGAGTIITAIEASAGVISLVLFPTTISELLKWFIIPEVKYLEMLRSFVT